MFFSPNVRIVKSLPQPIQLTDGSPFPNYLYIQNRSGVACNYLSLSDSNGNLYSIDDDEFVWQPYSWIMVDFSSDPITNNHSFFVYAALKVTNPNTEWDDYTDIIIINCINYNNTIYIECFNTPTQTVFLSSNVTSSNITEFEIYEIDPIPIYGKDSSINTTTLSGILQSGDAIIPTNFILVNNTNSYVTNFTGDPSTYNSDEYKVNINYLNVSDSNGSTYVDTSYNTINRYFTKNSKVSEGLEFLFLPGEVLTFSSIPISSQNVVTIYMEDDWGSGYYIFLYMINGTLQISYHNDDGPIHFSMFPIFNNINNDPSSVAVLLDNGMNIADEISKTNVSVSQPPTETDPNYLKSNTSRYYTTNNAGDKLVEITVPTIPNTTVIIGTQSLNGNVAPTIEQLSSQISSDGQKITFIYKITSVTQNEFNYTIFYSNGITFSIPDTLPTVPNSTDVTVISSILTNTDGTSRLEVTVQNNDIVDQIQINGITVDNGSTTTVLEQSKTEPNTYVAQLENALAYRSILGTRILASSSLTSAEINTITTPS